MQLQRFNLDGTGGGVTEMSVLTNQEYIDAAIASSEEDDGYDVILGTNLIATGGHQPELQNFVLFASQGLVRNTNLVP